MKILCYPNQIKDTIKDLIAIFIKKSQFSFLAFEENCGVKDAMKYVIKASESDDVLSIGFFSDEVSSPIVVTLYEKGAKIVNTIKLNDVNQSAITSTEKTVRTVQKQTLKRALYNFLKQYYEPMSEWGILTGIRPVKIVHHLLDEGFSLTEVEKHLEETLLLTQAKANLIMEIAMRERNYLYPRDANVVSLYLCIPFCPTRCLYCSFPSNDVRKKGRLMPEYTDKLIQELAFVMLRLNQLGKRVDCIYIGGGTPTALSEVDFSRLMQAITTHVPMKGIREFTVEAGRPNTITPEKLEAMSKASVTRICINPQTMQNETLKAIGRIHSASDIKKVMRLAKSYQFKVINMDLILGLPGETVLQVEDTLKEILALEPESVTLHTLAVKRASRLNEQMEMLHLTQDKVVGEMMHKADAMLRDAKITPYYMYRQKKMIGHLENVGYAVEGAENLYNMRMMEETQTIIALGAGAVSKYAYDFAKGEDVKFTRIANFKDVEAYLNRFDEIIAKKEEGFELIKVDY